MNAPVPPAAIPSAPDAPRPPVVGVTGAPGAGKSLAAAFFREAGCAVVDVDALGHEALADPGVQSAVLAEFGAAVAAGARLDRRALAGIVFQDPSALRRLEQIVHPWVNRRLAVALAAARSRAGTRAVVVDCALLFESGIDGLCDVTVCVTAPPDVRADRVAGRGWNRDELRRREGFQFPPEEKARRATCLLPNDGDPASLGDAVLALLDGIAPGVAAAPRSGSVTAPHGNADSRDGEVVERGGAHPARPGEGATE